MSPAKWRGSPAAPWRSSRAPAKLPGATFASPAISPTMRSRRSRTIPRCSARSQRFTSSARRAKRASWRATCSAPPRLTRGKGGRFASLQPGWTPTRRAEIRDDVPAFRYAPCGLQKERQEPMRFMILMAAAALLPTGAVAQEAVVYGATYVEVAPSATSQAIGLLKALVTASRKEDGNLRFHMVQERQRPNRFVVIEAWKDLTAYDGHLKSLPYLDFKDKLAPIRNAPLDERVHNALAAAATMPAPSRGAIWIITHVDVPPPSKDACIAELKTLTEAR